MTVDELSERMTLDELHQWAAWIELKAKREAEAIRKSSAPTRRR